MIMEPTLMPIEETAADEHPPSLRWGMLGAAVALLAYLATMGTNAFPGRSVEILVQYTGIGGTQPLLYPLYEWVTRAVTALPLGTLAFRAAILSALCAWGVLVLLFAIVSRAVYRAIDEETDGPIRDRVALVAGFTAILFLAFSKPFWFVANRADFATFHLLLFLGVSYLFLEWWNRSERLTPLYLFAFLYGLGAAEFPTFFVFAPLFGAALLVRLASQGRLTTGRFGLLMLAALAGLTLALLAVARYVASPQPEEPVRGFLHALKMLARGHALLILRSLPAVGWIIVGLTTFGPWLILLLVHRRGLRHETGWSFPFLHAIFSLAILALAFDFTLSPWRLVGEQGLLVTPYACAAMVAGYLVAYWILEMRHPWFRERQPKLDRVRAAASGLLAVLIVASLVGVAVRNAPANNVRQARVFDQMARQVIQTVGERQWLLTDGVLDNHLRLAAHEAGKAIRFMDLSRAEEQRHMRELAAEFDSVRMRNQAELGLIPFLQEWFRTDPQADRKIALMFLPDLWYAAERIPVPEGLVFIGYRENEMPDWADLKSRNFAFWSAVKAQEPKHMTGTALLIWRHFNRHISLLANNLGVLLEDYGRPDDAYAAYAFSRTVQSNNLSALLNQYAMHQTGYAGGDAGAVSNALAEAEVGLMDNYQVWNLARFYGYVRLPEAFAGMGWTWALSGHPGLAISGLKRALSLSQEVSVREDVDLAMAAIYITQNQPEESQRIYEKLLARNRSDVRALLGMAELSLRWRKPDEARAYIERAEAAGASRGDVAQAWALYHMAIGEAAKARVFLEELVATYTGMTSPLHMLANVLLIQGDEKALERLAKQIREMPKQDFHTCRALAVAAAARNDGPAMRAYLEQALLFKPRDANTLDLLLRMDMREGREEYAERHAKELLRARPDHAYANYVLGNIQMKRREYALAEDSLRRSLGEYRTPETLNDLAWAVLMAGRVDEAETLVREAIQRNNQLAAAWDTLGMAYYRQGKLKDARDAFRKALELMPDVIEFQLHLALVEADESNWRSAEELAGRVQPKANRLWSEDRELLKDLTRRIRENIRE